MEFKSFQRIFSWLDYKRMHTKRVPLTAVCLGADHLSLWKYSYRRPDQKIMLLLQYLSVLRL